jgi:predicted neuraminidase
VRLSDGCLLAYMRTGGKGGLIWRAESRDDGETWSQPTATNLPNPNSGIDLLRLQSGALVLAYNPSDCVRTPLCVAIAEEDELWRWQRTLEDAPAEFSYPTLTQTAEGQIHLVYTYQREHIQYARFTEEWLRAGGDPERSPA